MNNRVLVWSVAGSALLVATLMAIRWVAPSDAQNPRAEAKAPSPRELDQPLSHEVEACHDRTLTAREVPLRSVTGTAPDSTGGTLVDGAYDVVGYDAFGSLPVGATDKPFRQTIWLEGNGTVAKTTRIGVSGRAETTTWKVSVSGSELTLTGVCPVAMAGAEERIRFSASHDILATHFQQYGVPVVVTYRRRAEK